MIFFEFKELANPEICGRRFPQISGILDRYTYPTDAVNSILRVNTSRELPKDLIVPKYVLHGHAIRTDMLSVVDHSSQILLFSSSLLKIIESHNIPPVQIFNTAILSKKKEYDYRLFYIIGNFIEFIDFEKSTFCLAKTVMRTKIESMEINTLEQFKQAEAKYPRPNAVCVAVEKLILAEESIPFDMFRILGTITAFFVSERLKNAIQEAGCTGMNFINIQDMETVFYR